MKSVSELCKYCRAFGRVCCHQSNPSLVGKYSAVSILWDLVVRGSVLSKPVCWIWGHYCAGCRIQMKCVSLCEHAFSGITVLSYSLFLFVLFGFCYMVYLVTYHKSECQKHWSMCNPSCLVIQGNLHPVHIDQSRLSHFTDLKIWVSSVSIYCRALGKLCLCQ